MVGNGIVGSHGPGICGNIVNLNVKIGADTAAGNAVDFAVEAGTGVKLGRDGIRWEARVIGIGDRIVAPERCCRREVLIHAAKEIDIGAVACAAERGTRCWEGGDGRPGVGRGVVLIRVCDSGVVGDAAEAIDLASL